MTAIKLPVLLLPLLFTVMQSAAVFAQDNRTLEHGLTTVYGRPLSPELDLAGLDGQRYQLSGYRGKIVIVNFWATWCPPCVEELPALQRAWEQLHQQNFQVLAVNLGEDEATINDFLEKSSIKIGFPILLGDDQSIVEQWKISGLPLSYIVDTTGRLSYSALGPRNFGHEHIMSRLRALMVPGPD